uniref:hypothetical protein n=1 Tax=Roseivirga sp. TaxID=1964215 RepID=UPI004047C465
MVPDRVAKNRSLIITAGTWPKEVKKEESSPKAIITKTVKKENVPKMEENPSDALSDKLLKTHLPFSTIVERMSEPMKVEIEATIKRLIIIKIKAKENT